MEKIYRVMRTKADAEIVLGYIDTIVNSLYGLNDKSFEKVVRKMPNEEVVMVMLAEIRKVPENLRIEYLRKLKEEIKSSETMKLTVAVNLSEEMMGEIVEELRKKWGRLVVDFEVRPEIMGGAKISWRGRYWEKILYDKYDKI